MLEDLASLQPARLARETLRRALEVFERKGNRLATERVRRALPS